METLQIILLAIIQGITEFLPISSQSHLIVMSNMMGMPDRGLGFDIALHSGSLFAILTYYRKEVCQILSVSGEGKNYIRLIIIGSIPLPIVALGFMDFVSMYMRSINSIALMTILFAIVLYIADARQRSEFNNFKTMSMYAIIIIGTMQALAIIPGVSRSGIVITTALFLKFSRDDSIKIAFLLSIPALFMATMYQSAKLYQLGDTNLLNEHLLGVSFSFIASYLTIHFFISSISKITFTPYIIYRILLGLVLLSI